VSANDSTLVTTHGSACGCVRCAGFQPGHELSLRHGAYSTIRLSARAAELRDELVAVMPIYSPADEPTVRLLALALARCEAATAALDEADEMTEGKPLAPYLIENAGALARLREDLRSWLSTSAKLANSLGLSPLSRSRLGLNVARTESSVNDETPNVAPAAPAKSAGNATIFVPVSGKTI
jgi:hypothetical protein